LIIDFPNIDFSFNFSSNSAYEKFVEIDKIINMKIEKSKRFTIQFKIFYRF